MTTHDFRNRIQLFRMFCYSPGRPFPAVRSLPRVSKSGNNPANLEESTNLDEDRRLERVHGNGARVREPGGWLQSLLKRGLHGRVEPQPVRLRGGEAEKREGHSG